MDMSDWVFVLEFGGGFAVILLLGWWQLRVLKKDEEREKAEEAARDASPAGAAGHSEGQHRANDGA